MNAREFLADDLPMYFDESGNFHCAIPYELSPNLCPHCHEPMLVICDLQRCLMCPVLNQWLDDSRRALNRAKARQRARLLIQIVPDFQFQEAA